MRRVGILITAALLSISMLLPGAVLANSGASGEKEYIDENFTSTLWSGLCGFEVTRTEQGHQRIWEEPRGNGTIFRGVFAITVTLTGPTGKTYTFRDAGADIGTLLPDGLVHFAIIGRSFPNNTIGRMVVIDDEVVKLSGRTAYDPQEICAQIAP